MKKTTRLKKFINKEYNGTEETLPGFEPDAVRDEMLGKIEEAAHEFVSEVFRILKNTPSPCN